jgi:hypothetical protein
MIKLIISFNALLFSVLAFFDSPEKPKSISDMPMCSTMQDGGINQWTGTAIFTKLPFTKATPSVFATDETKSYAMPLLTQTPKGEILMSWMEKDEKGVTAFCFSTSTDKGKTFSDKKVIYSGSGVSSSRLFRAKLLAKKDGSLVAVFPNRSDAPPAASPAQGQPQAQQGQGGQGGGRGGRGGGGRSMDLVYTVSKDGGNTWTSLQVVDSDPTKAMRGFFDAIVLPNDEIAVAYLKDVKNSTKHEERDLRIVITKNGVFQAEKLLDAVVCDCCNINMLVDANGALNVIYRDNDNDIRDFSKMVSTDNGETFSKPQNIYSDGWKIAGCPHNGAISSVNGKGALIAYYSGAESESGVKLVTQEGKKLFVLDDPSVKNPALMGSAQAAAMLWEQGGEKSKLVFRTIKDGKVSETTAVEGSDNATNATGLVIDNQLLIAHEVKQEGKKMSLKIATTGL